MGGPLAEEQGRTSQNGQERQKSNKSGRGMVVLAGRCRSGRNCHPCLPITAFTAFTAFPLITEALSQALLLQVLQVLPLTCCRANTHCELGVLH